MSEGIIPKAPRKENEFGVPMGASQLHLIKRRLDLLADKAPAFSKISLHFEQRKSCLKGVLSITEGGKEFVAVKAAHEPVQVFFLLEEEIFKKLEDWKTSRFSSPATAKTENAWRFA